MFRLLAAAALLSAAVLGTAAEFRLSDEKKTVVTCDEIVLSKETPRAFITAKTASATKTYKFSEVDLTSLPAAAQAEFAAFKLAQLKHRLILKDDKWVSRNELLLKEDKTYGYKRALGRVGDSILEFVNDTKETVTLAVRQGDAGYEMHLEAGRKKGYQVPDGNVLYYFATESADGTRLMIKKSKPVELKHTRLTVTIVLSDDVDPSEIGSIVIPPEYRVPQE